MSSVQELITAAQAKQKPSILSQLAEVGQAGIDGYGAGVKLRNTEAETRQKLAEAFLHTQAAQAVQEQQAYAAQRRRQLGIQTDGIIQQGFKTAINPGDGPVNASPVEKMKHKVSIDEKGGVTDTFDPIEPKPVEDPTSLEGILAKKVNSGEMTLDEAMKAKQRVADPTAANDRAKAEQDRLEKDAQSNLLSVRGDHAIATVESQRDTAINAYNRLASIKAAGKLPNPVDYVDILGQLYKARTGTSPTDTVLNDARQQTAKGKFGKVYTYFTGEQAPATTQGISDSLMEMADQMGKQSDQLHEGYMKARLHKPKNLDPQIFQPIADSGRGTSFEQATAEARKALSGAGAGQPQTKTINGQTFVNQNGKWYHQ